MVEANASMSSSQQSSNSTQTKLEDYTIGTVLGQGAFGKVMLATDKQGQTVAIKEVNKA